MAKYLPGPKPEPKQHRWASDNRNYGAGAFVLAEPDGTRTCLVCGVSEERTFDAFRPDRKFAYRDAHGKLIYSKTELPCPVFVGDHTTAIADNQQGISETKGRVSEVENEVAVLHERMAWLEQENARLRDAIEAQPQVTTEAVLTALAAISQRMKQAGPMQLEDKSLGNILDLVWDDKQEAFIMTKRDDDEAR